MANGFIGSKAEWEKMIAPLDNLDNTLENFASTHDLPLKKNERNTPGREFRWGSSLKRLIQIFGYGKEWNLWICAYEDRRGKQYWKELKIKKNVSINEIEKDLQNLLDESFSIVTSWTEKDLEPVKRKYR